MTFTRSKTKAAVKRPVLSGAKLKQDPVQQKEVLKVLPKVSPRDITNCSLEKDDARAIGKASARQKEERQMSKRPLKVHPEAACNQTIDDKNLKTSKPVSSGEECPSLSKDDKDTMKGISTVADGVGENMKKERNEASQEPGKEEAMEVVDIKREEARQTEKTEHSNRDTKGEKSWPKIRSVARRVSVSLARHSTNNDSQNGAMKPCQTEENATSSSSSTSRRTLHAQRTSLAYLQRTRAQRRKVAKARTAYLRRQKDEEGEQKRRAELDVLEEGERERVLQGLEDEKRVREETRKREVKRVKNRISVEKSRVRELVFEVEKENEGGVLAEENEKLRDFVVWVRGSVLTEVKRELSAFQKRKREVGSE